MVVDRVFVHIANNAGSMTAGAAGVLGSAAAITGQMPTPDWIPTWVWVLILGVGPACAWFLSRILAALAAYAHERHLAALRRHIKSAERGRDDEADAFLEHSDKWLAWSKAISAAKWLEGPKEKVKKDGDK